jgi:hypothetical protein
MAVPTGVTYSVAAIAAANTAFLDLLDAESGAASIKIRDADDVLLATVPLDDPAGTVAVETGILTLSIAGPDESAAADGTAAYGELCDGAGAVLCALPCAEGLAPSSGYLVLQTLTIVAGGTVVLYSATIS